jgi:hypothetical protein
MARCSWASSSHRFPPTVWFTKATLRGFWKLELDPPDEFLRFFRKEKEKSIGYFNYGYAANHHRGGICKNKRDSASGGVQRVAQRAPKS